MGGEAKVGLDWSVHRHLRVVPGQGYSACSLNLEVRWEPKLAQQSQKNASRQNSTLPISQREKARPRELMGLTQSHLTCALKCIHPRLRTRKEGRGGGQGRVLQRAVSVPSTCQGFKQGSHCSLPESGGDPMLPLFYK